MPAPSEPPGDFTRPKSGSHSTGEPIVPGPCTAEIIRAVQSICYVGINLGVRFDSDEIVASRINAYLAQKPSPDREVAPVERVSIDLIFVGAVDSRYFVEAQRQDGVWTFFLPRPESPEEARWFGSALWAAAAEAEK